jgi:alpha-amylase
MGVLLQGFFKLPPNQAVPSPADGDQTVQWWWDHLAAQANDFMAAGFTAIWLPPVLKSSAGDNPGADGYGPFDDYDIGSKKQMGSIPTRYGTREQLQRCVAILRANGLDVYLDMVEHQRSGDPGNFIFRYLGADGTPSIGRFPKDPSNFLPQVPRDPDLGGAPSDDIPFGRELAPINARPSHYVFDNLIAAADWLTRSLNAQGYRIDDVKGISTDFLLPFLNSEAMAGKFAVGEFFDGNRVLVNGWVFNPRGMRGRSSAFDFPLRFVLASMCNNPDRFNMADLDQVGLIGISPLQAVTFVENHDTDLQAGQRVVTNKILGYAYILTSEGYPCVYYRDYSEDKDCYGLKPLIDNLIWIHEKLASGPTQQRWKDFDVFAYERLGALGLLVGLNNDPFNVRTITVATNFGANATLHDYTGHAGNVMTDADGTASITIPSNTNGAGYVCYSRDGVGGGFDVAPQAVTQDFEGATDLDIPPVTNGKTVTVGRIWCVPGSPIQATLTIDQRNWTATTAVTIQLLGPDGAVMAHAVSALNAPQDGALRAHARAATPDFYTLQLQSENLPASSLPYTLSATYTAPQEFVPAAPTAEPRIVGQWSEVIPMSNVPIHTHVLPTGKVLYWGRRQDFQSTEFDTLNEHQCFPFIWDPATRQSTPARQPTLSNGETVNLFCSGHTFLADGRLMVVGGHLFDSQGTNQASVYDPVADTWTALPTMNDGRWYPTAVTLPDGTVVASSGSFATGPLVPPPNQSAINNIPQVWNGTEWEPLSDFNQGDRPNLPLFPRMHVGPDGRVFMSGSLAESFLLDTRNGGNWTGSATRAAQGRDYAPSVLYDVGKVLFIGGGQPPTNIAETIDLTAPNPQWVPTTSPMHFARRQHNATLLPDGTVLVTGGTAGSDFNDLTNNLPVREAELWDPATGIWTIVAAERRDRCYHSTAVLLPDATVLSAGGGEYAPNLGVVNAPADSHADAQIFSPPYLFKSARPIITEAPASVAYGQAFTIGVGEPQQIKLISWIRLSSVTHSFDQNQCINFLEFTSSAQAITVTAPANANICPPGHYMLFVLNGDKVPSVAKIVQIGTEVVNAPPQPQAASGARVLPLTHVTPIDKAIAIAKRAQFPPVTVGVTATCPYGIKACWGNAAEALQHLQDVRVVSTIPDFDAFEATHDTRLPPEPDSDDDNSVGFVYLTHGGLPAIDVWHEEFRHTANDTHLYRGVEVMLSGPVADQAGQLVMPKTDERQAVTLAPIQEGDKIQWDRRERRPKSLTDSERSAYQTLKARVDAMAGKDLVIVVKGPLKMTANGLTLSVRRFGI